MRGMEYYLDAMENGPQLSGRENSWLFVIVFSTIKTWYVRMVASMHKMHIIGFRLFTHSTKFHNCRQTTDHCQPIRLATWCIFWRYLGRNERRAISTAKSRPRRSNVKGYYFLEIVPFFILRIKLIFRIIDFIEKILLNFRQHQRSRITQWQQCKPEHSIHQPLRFFPFLKLLKMLERLLCNFINYCIGLHISSISRGL